MTHHNSKKATLARPPRKSQVVENLIMPITFVGGMDKSWNEIIILPKLPERDFNGLP
jgi:hypothetical protein